MHAISKSVNIPICPSIQAMWMASGQVVDPQMLKPYIIQGWSQNKDEVEQGMQKYWPIGHELAMISDIARNGK